MLKEEVLNTEIGRLLRKFLYGAEVHIEENNQIQETAKRPDLVVVKEGRESVLIENKIDEESALIQQCESRLTAHWLDGRPVRAVVGILSPTHLVKNGNPKQIVKEQSFRYATWNNAFGRFPASGWLQGSILDVAGFIDRVGANSIDLDALINQIRSALQQASLVIDKDDMTSRRFSKLLKQKPSSQTNRMGLAMIFNAIVFQSHIARHHGKVPSPSQMLGAGGVNQAGLVRIWRDILEIDYSPIFYIARELLQSMADTRTADSILERIFETAISVAKETGSQGLIGTVFGELISDRKLLASFYTMPQSSALITELAVSRLATDWSKQKDVEALRIGDLAVGTGTLLVAAYKRIAERYLLSANNPSKLHRAMMEGVMIGCDIDPSAVHITASRLSGENPSIDYHSSQTYVMPYGYVKLRGGAKEYKLGSLDLFAESPQKSLFGSGLEALGSKEVKSHADVDIPHGSLDIVVMNPPFTRPTNHEIFKEGFPNPAFAGLSTEAEDQRQMSATLRRHLKRLDKPIASHGNAGLASNFIDLAHVKLKDGGILALIVPATVVSGASWSGAREVLAKHYRDIVIITIAAQGKYSRNWSADTSLSEAIVIARKSLEKQQEASKAQYATLNKRPATILEAIEIAKAIQDCGEDGYLAIGEELVGWVAAGSFAKSNVGHPSGIKNIDLVKFAKHLLRSKCSLPRIADLDIPITTLGVLGDVGPLDRDIVGLHPDKTPRGAFTKHGLQEKEKYKSVSYPMLWSHDTLREKRMIVQPDSEGVVLGGMRHQALKTWSGYSSEGRYVAGAAKLHINRDFGTSSSSLGACLTSVKSIGGRAWPSFQVNGIPEEDGEKAIALWLNTTLGLIGRWWVSSRQQPGRSISNISTIPGIPVVNLQKVTKKQICAMAKLFDRYSEKELKSAYLADQDSVRQALDKELLIDILNLPESILEPLKVIRRQWCSESSVRGDKATA